MKINKLILLLSVMLCFNCAVKNEKGNKRVGMSAFHIKPVENPKAYTYIDTTKLYKAFDDAGDEYNNALTKYDYYMKFYGNGRVGGFTGSLKDTMAFLNPLHAKMGYYAVKENQFIIEQYISSPQGGGVARETFLKKDGDTLIMSNGKEIYKYRIIDVSSKFLVYKPDW
jgi:hypothetical protein